MIPYEKLYQHGLGRMRYLLDALGTAPYLGKTAQQILEEEDQSLKRTTIREICFEKDEGEVQGTIKVQITDDDVTMQVLVDSPVPSHGWRWMPVVLFSEQKDLIRKYEASII